MKTLTNYKKNGFDFTLLKRIGNIGLFCGTKEGRNSVKWEVIKIKSHNGMTIAGTYIEPAEYAPSNNEWGASGWTYANEESAMGKIKQMIGDKQ